MIYATSDLHGMPLCKFKALLEKVGFCEKDTLYVLGDVIDRGSHGIELLLWIMDKPNIKLIMGNHEAMMLVCSFIFEEITESFLWSLSYDKLKLLSNWLNNGGGPTIEELGNTPKESIEKLRKYLKSLPLYMSVQAGGKDFLLTHSGIGNFEKNKKLSEYTADDFLWTRPAFSQRYYNNIITVFGHTPTDLYPQDYKGKILKTETWINIDTGNNPSILRLDDLAEFYC